MKKIKKKLIVGVILICLCFTLIPQLRDTVVISYLNVITTTQLQLDENDDKLLLMSGEINSKTPKQLKEFIGNNPQVTTLVLVDIPGSVNDEVNIPMATWVRESGLDTYMRADGHVASGGTDLFLAGNNRAIEDGAKIGVHSWQDMTGTEAKDLPKDHEDHKMYVRYTEEMLGDAAFYWYTIYAASANDIYYMTNDEILEYNLITEPVL